MLTETDRNFFRPKWRRTAATILCAVWATIEWLSGAPFWGIIASGLTLYCLWNFFYRFDERIETEDSSASNHKQN